jgi:hypothetical protein
MATNPYATRSSASIDSGTSSSNVSEREDLANFISMITRDETPFLSSIGKTKATAVFHEWQTDSLAAPGNSKLGEGADYITPTANGVTTEGGVDSNRVGPNRTRLGNFTQINGKTIAVSGTKRAVDQAGVADEYAYQLKKRGTELRRDIEADIVNSNQVASGSGTRTMGGYTSWVNNDKTVVYKDSSNADADVFASPAEADQGEGSTGITLGSGVNLDAITLDDIDVVMQGIYEEGGNATTLMTSPKIRRDISALANAAGGVRRNIDESGSLRQSVDVYMSDFGDISVVPNYIMGLDAPSAASADAITSFGNAFAFIYDPSYWAMATLRSMSEVDVGQKGDSTVGMLVEESTLECKNPIASGAIYGLK